MSWYSKVVWSEGQFLRPQHLQQHDRYVERLVEARSRHVTPYPWGFSALEIDLDLARQGRFMLRHAAGLMVDGTPFAFPADSPAPEPADVPRDAASKIAWLVMPLAAPNVCEIGDAAAGGGTRYVLGEETLIDASAAMRAEEMIEVAHPRLSLEIGGKTVKAGHAGLPIARIREVRDKEIVFDGAFVPPLLLCHAHPVVLGWLDRVLGWLDNKLGELARYATDFRDGGGLQNADYLVLQVLNRSIAVLRHLRASRFVHPERLYEELLRLAGELATFATAERRAAAYPAYDHDDLRTTFEPLLRDLQAFLSAQFSRRPLKIAVEPVEDFPTAYTAEVPDPVLFQTATFILDVASDRPAAELQSKFASLFKLGPDIRMHDIVYSNVRGVPLIHQPTVPPDLRPIRDHVYFKLDKTSPLWPDFSRSASIEMHDSGNWPGLQLVLWAITGA
ncbi:type VI secretion system baseplate subunit TssK [Zavarzinia sp.]|uniref:type VI secretion system baseplate subunit TssK n=1 Tax=Zavarzinia sp. TaxID=2027920 RepID=UPI003563F3B9